MFALYSLDIIYLSSSNLLNICIVLKLVYEQQHREESERAAVSVSFHRVDVLILTAFSVGVSLHVDTKLLDLAQLYRPEAKTSLGT